MMKESLEMMPVALIMAFTLYFGAAASRPSRIQQNTTPSSFTAIATSPSTVASNMRDHGVASSHTAGDSATEIVTIFGRLLDEEETAKHEAPPIPIHREFINRKTPVDGVPYFTSEDIHPSDPTAATRVNLAPAAKPAQGGAAALLTASDGKIRINEADANTLMRIPGIGRTRATTLLTARPGSGFRDWSEIDKLPGFGVSTIEMMKMYANLD